MFCKYQTILWLIQIKVIKFALFNVEYMTMTMTTKPTYQELLLRVRQLEQENCKLKADIERLKLIQRDEQIRYGDSR